MDQKKADYRFIYYLLKHITPFCQAITGGVATPIINKTTFEKIYKEYYVSYIDILGYKQFFIDHPDREESLLDAISTCYQNIIRKIKMLNSFFQ